MPARKYDYYNLEREFIRGRMSIRELARNHGIPDATVSSVHAQARRRDAQGMNWYDKRAQYWSITDRKTFDIITDREAVRQARLADAQDEAVEAIKDAIGKMRADFKATRTVIQTRVVDGVPKHFEVEEPLVRYGPKELIQLLAALSTISSLQSRNIGAAGSEGTGGFAAGPAMSLETAQAILDVSQGVAPVDRGSPDEGFPQKKPEEPRPN
jgi:hypothetical protein